VSSNSTATLYNLASNPIVAALISAAIIAAAGFVWRYYFVSRGHRKQAYSELHQLIAEIERENQVRPGSMIARATGGTGPFPYRVHKKVSEKIEKLMQKQGRYLKPETLDLWNNRRVALRHSGDGLDAYEDVFLDEFIAHAKGE
jgi:hypothetical protein